MASESPLPPGDVEARRSPTTRSKQNQAAHFTDVKTKVPKGEVMGRVNERAESQFQASRHLSSLHLALHRALNTAGGQQVFNKLVTEGYMFVFIQ